MYHRFALLLLLSLILISSPITHGQEVGRPAPGAPAPSPSPAVDPATEKKALDLLESLSEQAAKFHSAANRIRASATIADLLWARDENRARALFAGAVTDLATQIDETEFGDRENYQEISRIHELRQILVMRIAPHDPEMALNALRQTRVPAAVTRHWNPQNEANLELNLANFIVVKNPELALKIARASLARELSWNVISFVSQLAQKDLKLAQVFYDEVVAQLKSDDKGRNAESANYALSLLVSFQPPQANEEAFRDLLTTVLGEMLNLNRETPTGMNTAHNFYNQMEALKPLIEKYAPTRSSELRDWSRRVERTLDPATRIYQELNRLSQTASADELLALAEKYPPEFQNMIYQNAAWKALSGGDVAKAKEITRKMSDPFQRRQMLDQIEASSAGNIKDDDKLAQARVRIGKARTLNQKVELIIQTASSLSGINKKTEALELLNEGKVLVNAAPHPGEQMKAQLRLAQAYAAVSPGETFAILQPLVIRLNEMLAAAAVLDGIDARYFKDGDWEMPGANNLGTIVSGLDQILAGLGRTDFDRALALVEQIERPEVRTMIEVNLAQAVLNAQTNNHAAFGGRIMTRGFVIQ